MWINPENIPNQKETDTKDHIIGFHLYAITTTAKPMRTDSRS